MPRPVLAALGLCGLLVAGCGSTAPLHFKGRSRPSPPLAVSVYVNGHGISISPSSLGSGLVVFYVTNQATRAALITLSRAHQTNAPSLSSGDLEPDATATLTANLGRGRYVLTGAGVGGRGPAAIAPAELRIGAPRDAGDSALLQP